MRAGHRIRLGDMSVRTPDEFKRLRKRMQQASRGALKERMLKSAAAEALTQVQLGFRSGIDPYGKPWAKLKFRRGQPLRDTRILQNSFSSRPTSNGFVVGTNREDKIVVTHQEGRTIVPKKAPLLAFKVPGKIGKGARRGKPGWVFAKKVVVPARKMVPDKGQLSNRWQRAIDAAVNTSVRNFFKRGV